LAAFLDEILVALETRLVFRLARLGRSRNPFALALDRALARFLFAAFLFEAFLFLHKPGRIVALIGNSAAAIELQNPAGDVVEKVAIVGDDQNRAGISLEVVL